MASWKALLLFGLVLTAASLRVEAAEEAADEVSDDEYAETERAHLIVRKFFGLKPEERAVQGRNLTVHIELTNAGSRCVRVVS
jgi:hypothetical protein